MRSILKAALIACVAAAPAWEVIKPNLATILFGIDFPDANIGYVAGGQDGEGPIVLKTTDGGATFQEIPHAGSALMFLGLAFGTKTNGVVGGIGLVGVVPGIEYTTNGNYFNRSYDAELVAESQSVETIKGAPGAFALAGEYGKKNGVAVSRDLGITWKHIDAKLNTSSRYGSYPSRTTWYLSAGQFPTTSEGFFSSKTHKVLTERIAIDRTTSRPTYRLQEEWEASNAGNADPGYVAAIAKTTDGGATWSTVYYDEGNFYFNAISCPTTEHCWVVGESNDGPAPGARILHTENGGKTWTVQLYETSKAYSLMDIHMISDTEGWAVGGKLDATFTGTFYHTTDGGKTWKEETVKGVYATNMHFVKSSLGYATAFTRQSQSSVLQYK